MKRSGWFVLAFVLVGTGCLHLPNLREEPKKEAESKKIVAPVPPVVIPDQVNEKNAPTMLQALTAEIAHDEAEPAGNTSPMDGEKK